MGVVRAELTVAWVAHLRVLMTAGAVAAVAVVTNLLPLLHIPEVEAAQGATVEMAAMVAEIYRALHTITQQPDKAEVAEVVLDVQ